MFVGSNKECTTVQYKGVFLCPGTAIEGVCVRGVKQRIYNCAVQRSLYSGDRHRGGLCSWSQTKNVQLCSTKEFVLRDRLQNGRLEDQTLSSSVESCYLFPVVHFAVWRAAGTSLKILQPDSPIPRGSQLFVVCPSIQGQSTISSFSLSYQ